MLTPTSQAPGVLGAGVDARNAGTATLSVQGPYTGTIDRNYRVQITDATAGTEQFIYSDDGGVTWQPAQAAPAFTWILLTHGIYIMFTPGPAAPQAVLGDEWRFSVFRPFGVANLIDLNRDNECRTGALALDGSFAWDVDFGVPLAPPALILFDHNIPSGTNIALAASTTSDFAVLNVNESVTWASSKIRHLISNTTPYRYWRFTCNSLSAAMTYIRASELYLGDVITMGSAWSIGYEDETVNTGQSPDAVLMRGQGAYGFLPRRLSLEFNARKAGTVEDIGKLDTVYDLSHSATFLSQRPFFMHFDTVSSLTMFELCHWIGGRAKRHLFLDRLDVSAELLSLVRTAA